MHAKGVFFILIGKHDLLFIVINSRKCTYRNLHGSVDKTNKYLGSFEMEHIQKEADVLTATLRKATYSLKHKGQLCYNSKNKKGLHFCNP